MAEVLFFIAAIGAVAGALGVVSLRNPFYAVLALVGHLLSLAALFLLAHAEFVAAAQVVVYAGAVMVLYVFVVAYVGGTGDPLRPSGGPGLRAASLLFAVVLFVELAIAILGSGLKALGTDDLRLEPGFGSPEAIGEMLLTRFLFAFEAASFLLLIAAVGAVVLARRRGGTGIGGGAVTQPLDTPRPLGTGTMREGGGGLMAAPSTPAEPESPGRSGW